MTSSESLPLSTGPDVREGQGAPLTGPGSRSADHAPSGHGASHFDPSRGTVLICSIALGTGQKRYWRARGHGITTDAAQAHIYTMEEAEEITRGSDLLLIPASGIEAAKPARPDRGATEGDSAAPAPAGETPDPSPQPPAETAPAGWTEGLSDVALAATKPFQEELLATGGVTFRGLGNAVGQAVLAHLSASPSPALDPGAVERAARDTVDAIMADLDNRGLTNGIDADILDEICHEMGAHVRAALSSAPKEG